MKIGPQHFIAVATVTPHPSAPISRMQRPLLWLRARHQCEGHQGHAKDGFKAVHTGITFSHHAH